MAKPGKKRSTAVKAQLSVNNTIFPHINKLLHDALEHNTTARIDFSYPESLPNRFRNLYESQLRRVNEKLKAAGCKVERESGLIYVITRPETEHAN